MPDLPLEIAKQLNFIISSCRLYDKERFEEALRIAVAARVLFHNTKNSKAIVGGYLDGSNLKLVSTTMYRPSQASSHFLGFLGLHPSTGTFKAFLHTSERKDEIPWQEWWEHEPILQIGATHEVITRRQVALACANKDGGAHVDSVKPKEYEKLEDGIGVAVVARFSDGVTRKIKCRYANLAIMRQIGHEILTSPSLTSLAKPRT
jgi:hypothetical protein